MNESTTDRLDFLLVNVCHLHYLRAGQQFEALELYRGQPPLLRALWETEGVTQAELAEKMRITPATLTKMLQRMERAGFVRRANDPGDQRVLRVFLTEKGRAVRLEVERVWRTMEEETFAGFSDDERAVLRAFLLRMRTNLAAASGEEPWK